MCEFCVLRNDVLALLGGIVNSGRWCCGCRKTVHLYRKVHYVCRNTVQYECAVGRVKSIYRDAVEALLGSSGLHLFYKYPVVDLARPSYIAMSEADRYAVFANVVWKHDKRMAEKAHGDRTRPSQRGGRSR